jgi:hypothetical protein
MDGMIDSVTKTTIFSHCKPNPCLGVAIDHDLYEKNRDFDVYTEFEMFKIKVLIIFLGTVGFSLRRDGRISLQEEHQNCITDQPCRRS